MSVHPVGIASLLATFCLCLVAGGISSDRTTPPESPDSGVTLEDSLALGQASLNEMFREVEMLMEDTQHILEEAVDQMINESAKSLLNIQGMPQNYHNETTWEEGNHTITETIDLQTDETGDTHVSRSINISGEWNEVDHECMVDEDCDDFCYCLYGVATSQCLPCKDLQAECMKDEECCSEQQCVWGQCAEATTRGSAGTICQAQSDCSPAHCCAFHKELLFPVCTPRPGEGEACLRHPKLLMDLLSSSHPNLLMDLLSWDVDAPGEYCPCDAGLRCQPHGRGSLCVT